MTPKLKFNCEENWDKMKISMNSRHCDNCNKTVHDFTKSTRFEIIRFLYRNKGKSICGRVLPHQLDYSKKELLITINGLLKKENTKSNFKFYLLAFAALTLFSCSEQEITEIENSGIETPIIQIDSTRKCNQKTFPKPNKTIDNTDNENIDFNEPPITGEIIEVGFIAHPSEPFDEESIFIITEPMPEFPGGEMELIKYLSRVEYPQIVQDERIEGKVYVRFVIDTLGKPIDVEIARGIHNSLDKAALNHVKAMPNWIPGENNGKKVAVKMVIPFNFKLGK